MNELLLHETKPFLTMEDEISMHACECFKGEDDVSLNLAWDPTFCE